MADNTVSSFGDGDGYSLGPEYGDYGTTNTPNWQPPDYTNQTQNLVPLFGSSAYYNGTSNLVSADQGLIAPSNSQFLQSSGGLNAAGNFSGDSVVNSDGSSLMGGAGSAMGGVASGVVGGVGAVVGAYDNASTDTTGSVIGGAVSGAEAGAAFGPWGMAIGAVVGGIAGFFGSKSKKNQEKKAFQQQEQLAVLPAQQQEANYLQNEGLKQKAISNYASGYTPGGFNYTNALTGNKGGAPSTFKTPSGSPSLPNFNVSPTNVVPGSGDNSLGIAPQSTANNGVNLNPQYGNNVTNSAGLGNTGLVNPGGAATTAPWTPSTMPTAPGMSKDSATNNTNLAAYQKSYAQYLTDQNAQASAQALGAYSNFYG